MFEILIDTNIYRKDPVQSGLPFKAIAQLCKAKAASLHIPYIVLREFQTQQVDLYQKEMQAVFNRALKKWPSPADFVAQSANFSGWNLHPA